MNQLSKSAIVLLASAAVFACGGSSGNNDSPGDDNGRTNGETDNLAPQIAGQSRDYVRAGKLYRFTPVASDPENNQLLYSIENKPAWATFDQNTGELKGVPDETDISQYHDIHISVSDGVNTTRLPPFSIKVMYARIGRNNVVLPPATTVTPTADGYDIIGDAAISVGKLVTEFRNAELKFEYDEEGNLLDLAGSTELPPVISDNLSLDTSVNVIVGMYTGAEINANADIGPASEPGILLRDEFRYLVYFLDASVDLSFRGADGVEVPISLGIGATRTLIIADPTDPFFYYFGQIAGAAIGYGNSFNGNIPYQPIFEANGPAPFAALEPFLGSEILKGIFPISAFKVFDVLELTGTAVCQPPQLLSCGKPDPASLVLSASKALLIDGGIDPEQQIKLGINGTAAIKFGILGIDLFEYHLFDMAAMIDIGTTREHLALQGVIDPQQSVQPDWLPIEPVPDPNAILVGNLFADIDPKTGAGDFALSLYGDFRSIEPAATISGVITINPQGLQMTGRVDDAQNPISLEATVDDRALDASLRFGYDFQANADAVVNAALDRASTEVETLFNELQQAIGDYDFALSLEGFRSQIPAIVDDATSILDAIPARVYRKVYDDTYASINAGSYTYTDPVFGTKTTFYARDYVSASGTASSAASSARSIAQTRVDARKAELAELKTQAQETRDDTALRTALKTALLTVAGNDRYSQSVTVQRTISFKIAGQTVATRTFTFFNSTLRYTIIDAPTKAQLQTAAANVDNIGPRQTVMLNTQQLYNAAPKEDAIKAARAGIRNGSTRIPTVNGGGYTLTRDLQQSAYILLDNQRVDIRFNPLDPKAVITGVGDVIAKAIIP